MTFEQWLEEEYPDGMGSGFGGWYHQDDLEAAWNAGYDYGHAEATEHLATGGSFVQMRLSFKCKVYGDRPHDPCSGTTDDGNDLPCECRCHNRKTEENPKVIIYLSIGNSDDKLSQGEWAGFWAEIEFQVASLADKTHGTWFSNTVSHWQNACWCLEFSTPGRLEEAKEAAIDIRRRYRQDSVAWAVAETEFI